MVYTTFLLDLTAEGSVQHVPGTLKYRPDKSTVPKNAFAWKVTVDSNGVVAIRALRDQTLVVIAHGMYTTKLVDRRQRGSEPTPQQWWLVNEGIGLAMHQAQNHELPDEVFSEPIAERDVYEMKEAGPSYGQRVANEVRRERDRKKRRPIVFAGLAVVIVASIVVYLAAGRSAKKASSSTPRATEPIARPEPPALPTPPAPPTEPAARATTLDDVIAATPDLDAGKLASHRVRWSEVDVPSQTSLAKVEKDPAAEKGKRVCAEGTIDRITKKDLAGRPHFEGALLTQDGDRVVFVASGSTGELVKRDRAKLCGVVTGTVEGSTAVFGMFDLPENRNPTVEKSE